MRGVRNFVTNNQAKRILLDAVRSDFRNDINMVPAAGLEPARLAAGDFKSPTYHNELNGLG
jgi:hypothetical protein